MNTIGHAEDVEQKLVKDVSKDRPRGICGIVMAPLYKE